MISPPVSDNGNGRVRATVVETVRQPGRVMRMASWVVDVAIPKLIPDDLTGRLRRRVRSVDERLERTARSADPSPIWRGPSKSQQGRVMSNPSESLKSDQVVRTALVENLHTSV